MQNQHKLSVMGEKGGKGFSLNSKLGKSSTKSPLEGLLTCFCVYLFMVSNGSLYWIIGMCYDPKSN